MRAEATSIPGVLVLEPQIHADERGLFLESYNQQRFDELVGRPVRFVQDNHSRSRQGVLRGLHYQIHRPQGKLVRVVQGEVFDVAVDIRRSSPMFGQWVGVTLSAENMRQLWLPEGLAHGFLATSEPADLVYKVTDFYAPEHDRCICWSDPELAIQWPLPPGAEPAVSDKDRSGASLGEAELFP